MTKRYTITAALPYANGPVHIGHLAGVYVPADIYVRYLRLKKRDVVFVCGSDEHGVPITLKAKQRGVSPQDVVDEYHELNKKAFADFGISFDIYSRTSNKIHHETASEFFKKLHSENKFIEKTTEQYFDVEANQFLADRYITGTCPHCANESAYGDQCEKCGSSLNATDLINPKSMVSGNKPILKETTHWFLPLDKYQDFLEKWILQDHKEWKPNVYGQCKSWLDSGLQPRAVSRDLDWGIPVPIDGATGKVLYVWFDAPIGYISATKEIKPNDWEKYWKSEDTKLVHFIGKDNIVFHCIVFPAMLKADGSYILPENVPSNEFLNLEGNKISTSRNWAVWLHEYLLDFPDKEDVLRYVLCANAPETKDNDFTWSDFQARNNSELVAIFGNFINRTMVLSWKYYEGKVQKADNLEEYEIKTLAEIAEIKQRIEQNLENYKFREALKSLMDLARLGNKYIADTEPWKQIKTNPEKVKSILNVCIQISANLAILAEPFLPKSSSKLKKMMAIENLSWENAGGEIIKENHQLNQAELLFSNIEDAEIEKQITRLSDIKAQNELEQSTAKPLKENISFDDFTKLDIRVGTILEAEKVAKTKKLLKLLIDTGIDKRTVVSGIAEYYEPENIIGQQVSIIANLAPRDIKGIQSQGMILMAENANGELVFASPVKKVKEGSEVK